MLQDTWLEKLYEACQKEADEAGRKIAVSIPDGFADYSQKGQSHDAAYDAYMTGTHSPAMSAR